MARLQKVDDFVRTDHCHLTTDDDCYFWGEYTAHVGFGYSDTNKLIYNFKKSPLKRGKAEWHYKDEAIRQAAEFFRGALKPEAFALCTFVPVPPSKARDHPEYDDRVFRMLQFMATDSDMDIRELVVQTKSVDAAHATTHRPTPTELMTLYRIAEEIANPIPQTIVVFDDVLTTGCHFRAMKHVLLARYPGVQIVGFFIARRALASMTDQP